MEINTNFSEPVLEKMATRIPLQSSQSSNQTYFKEDIKVDDIVLLKDSDSVIYE